MGLLIDGKWHDVWYETGSTGGRFIRQSARFRNWVRPEGEGGFKAEADRYHLYVSLACPWAHRTLIFRRLKRLEQMIGVSVVDPKMAEQGWCFSERDGPYPDLVNGLRYLHQVYTRAEPGYSGRVTVPVLWDKQTQAIVSNESSEIIRMFNSAFDRLGAAPADYYPKALRAEIDAVNERVYDTVNNGVYRAGFATTQQAYDEAFDQLFDALDELEQRLARQRYLVGTQLTEADWRLFTTLVRFDPVYHGHFKCNHRRIVDYPNLWAWLRELYQVPGVADTVDMDHIRLHYYWSHPSINPTRIVAKGPHLDYAEPPRREHLSRQLSNGPESAQSS